MRYIDAVAHFLYCPTMLGKRVARGRWHHRIHLIPGWLLARVCDAHDRSLGVTRSEMRRRSMTCPAGHMTITGLDGWTCWCGGRFVEAPETLGAS